MSGVDVIIECLGWTLLHFLWEGLVIAIVLAIMLRVLRKASANSRYMAGCVALALMIAAPVATFMQLEKQPAPLPPTTIQIQMENLPVEITPRIIPTGMAKAPLTERKDAAVKMSWSERLTPLLPLVVAAWAIGVIALALRLSAGWLRVKRLKRIGTESMEEDWLARLSEIARRLRLKKSVRLCKSALVEVPTVIGWLRPIILMPAGCLTGLSAAQVEYILAHELAHVRRHDYLVNLLQCLAETVLFYHPGVWWVSTRIREEREHCCDDVAVRVCGNRLEYARTLAALEELRGSQSQLVMAAAGAPLLQRIRRLAGQSERNPSHPVWPVAAIIILTLVAILAIGFRSSRAVADQTQPPGSGTNRIVTGSTLAENAFTTTELPQVLIQVKFVEVYERSFPKSVFSLPGASNAVPVVSNVPLAPGKLPGLAHVKNSTNLQLLSQTTNLITQAFSGILNPQDYKRALKFLETSDGVDILTPPSFSTKSGRQAQVSVVDMIPILTNQNSTVTTLVPSGVILDINPIATNNFEVQLTTLASMARLADSPTVVLPRMELAQLSADTTVEDGQTLVMGGLMPGVVTKMKDKVPVLGDAPVIGKLFQKETIFKSRKYLIVFVTPTLINPDGSRYLPDKETSRKASKDQSKQDQGNVHITVGGTNELSQDGTHGFAWHQRDAAHDSDFRTNTQEASKQQSASTLVQDGKLLFESGKSDAAETKFQEALKLDPNNVAASYYLGLVRQKRDHAGDGGELKVVQPMLKWDAATASYSLGGVMPLPNFTLRTNSVKTSSARQEILATLLRAQANPADYDGLTLRDAVAKLNRAAKSGDSTQGEITFLIQQPSQAQLPLGAIDPTTGLPLHDVDAAILILKLPRAKTNTSIAAVLDCIATNNSLQYSIGDREVVFDLKPPIMEKLFTRVFHVDVTKFLAVVQKTMGQTFDEVQNAFYDSQTNTTRSGGIRNSGGRSYDAVQVLTRSFFSRSGLDFDPSKMNNTEKALFFNDRKGILMLHSSAEDLDAMERILLKSDVLLPQTQSEENPIKTDERATQQAQLPAGVAKTNLVKAIKGRKEIIAALNRIHADSADYEGLSLWDAVKTMCQTTISKDPGYSGVNFFIKRETPAQIPLPGGIDSSIGLSRSQAKDGDPGKIVLKPTREQIDVPLIAILDSIATNNSLQYTIEDYAVVFSAKADEPAPMYTRVYYVATNSFNKYLNRLASTSKNSTPTGSTNAGFNQAGTLAFLKDAGVDISPANPANVGKSAFYNETRGRLMVHATTQDLDRIEKALERINTTAYIQIKTRFVEMDEMAGSKIKLGEMMAGNGVKTNSIQTPMPVSAPIPLRKDPNYGSFPAVTNALTVQFTGVLTPEQYKEVMARLKQAEGVDILTAPDVTTESERQAQIQTVDIQTIVTGLTTVYTNGTMTNMLSTQTLPFGPLLDIFPKVSADDSSIEMTLVANVTEFLGYDDPKKLKGQKRTDVQIPLPRFKLRQLTSSADVLDGQTVVLGGIEPSIVGKPSNGKQGKRKTLLVFVTPTLINPDGTLYHAKTEQQAALQETK